MDVLKVNFYLKFLWLYAVSYFMSLTWNNLYKINYFKNIQNKTNSINLLLSFFVIVFVDTGIRSGTDILKCLALGAQAVFIGRPILYGLACGGDHGVQKVLNILKQELIYDMASCGITSIQQINNDIIYKHT